MIPFSCRKAALVRESNCINGEPAPKPNKGKEMFYEAKNLIVFHVNLTDLFVLRNI